MLWPAPTLEVMLFLAIVKCLAICWAFSYTISCATISAIKYFAGAGSFFIGWGSLSEWWFFLGHSNSIYGWVVCHVSYLYLCCLCRLDHIYSLFQGVVWNPEQSLSCIGVTDAKYNSIFDKGVLQCTEFSCFTQLSQHSNILINGFATFPGPWKEVFSPFTVFLEFLQYFINVFVITFCIQCQSVKNIDSIVANDR